MSGKYGRGALWVHNNEMQVREQAVTDLTGFKSSPVNYKLALWNPAANGMRYLKALIFTVAAGMPADGWARLRRIGHREIGDPITVRYDGEEVCMDYLQAVFELGFIADRMELDGARVLEIGAGYGRTCHALLSNHDLAAYHLVDLENSLQLAREYLRTVLDPEQFAKIRFVAVEEIDDVLRSERFDLCINVDSFAEMDAGTVRDYLALIDRTCRHAYVNNPVGKYLDESLDGHSQGAGVVELALSTGLLQKVVEIHDSRAVAAEAAGFLDAYRPGADWTCVGDSRAVPWSYYWQALYRNDGRS